jgi:hypothetical protein
VDNDAHYSLAHNVVNEKFIEYWFLIWFNGLKKEKTPSEGEPEDSQPNMETMEMNSVVDKSTANIESNNQIGKNLR